MINIERVKAVLCSMSSKSSDELEAFSPIISNAVAVISNLVDDELHSEERVEFLASAKANYDICLVSSCDDVSSFSAGDVSITQNASSKSSAKELLDSAMKNCADVVCDNGFAFLGV